MHRSRSAHRSTLFPAALLSALVAGLTTGCANVPEFGIPWVKQGPGISADEGRSRVMPRAGAFPAIDRGSRERRGTAHLGAVRSPA